ncbi:MAG TPA: hypothetical protein DGT23_03710 [Micromonosporaceae bacterium]|nr:hypothetical protein [Micromonosporaceae bacterium]
MATPVKQAFAAVCQRWLFSGIPGHAQQGHEWGDALLAAADLAFYHAKNDSRGVTVYQPGMTTPQLSRCRRRDAQELWDLALASPLEA